VSNRDFSLVPQNSAPLTQTAADQGQESPRNGEGNDGAAADTRPRSPEREDPHNGQVSNRDFSLVPQNSAPLTQTAADQGQESPRNGEGNDGAAADTCPRSPEQEHPHNGQVSNRDFSLVPQNSAPLTQTAADQGQESPRNGEGNDGTAADTHPHKRQKVSRHLGNVQPETRHSARVPRLTERAKEAW
jgi:hypothetical protein